MYEAGVLAALKEMLPDILQSAPKIYGASSGSIIATLALCDHDFDEITQAFLSALRSSFLSIVPGRTLFKILKDTLNKYLPTNVHQQVSGKLHVIVTRVHDWRSVVVSDFTSKEDLIQAILCSCFVPLYIGLLPPKYHGVRYVDGELGMWRADFMTQSMITVSAFAGEYDICPKDSPVPFFTFQISDCILYITKRNFCRFLYILKLPPHQVLDQFYIHGYQDTASFSKRLSEFGLNYCETNESCWKGEGTLHLKPEIGVLRFKATDPEDVTKENPGTIQAADEVEEEASHHLLHHPKAANSEESKCASPSTSRSRSARLYEAQE